MKAFAVWSKYSNKWVAGVRSQVDDGIGGWVWMAESDTVRYYRNYRDALDYAVSLIRWLQYA